MRWLHFCAVFTLCNLNCLAQSHLTLTQQQACARFSDAVVRIEAGGRSRGTGFIVSPDGFVLTAFHIIRDETGDIFSAITVKLPSGDFEFAKLAIPITLDQVGQDFALLKVDAKTKLPFLPLGSVEDVLPGGDATIIGYPFSAISMQDKNVFTKFCLSGAFAASDLETVPVEGTNKTPRGIVSAKKDVKVDVIYFQGPSVKGISGSPIISRETGRVVGIVSVKLTGIGSSLMELKKETSRGLGTGVIVGGLNPGQTVNEILTVLDDQLANDLGAATGINDPKHALAQAQQKTKQQSK